MLTIVASSGGCVTIPCVTETLAWQRRFTAPQIGFPAWCSRLPDRLAFISNETGSWQAWVVDRGTGERMRLSNEPIGVEQVLVAPDGRIVWWRDDIGDEQGRWMAVTPGEEPEPLLPGAPDGWAAGISFADGAIAFGVVVGEEYRAYLSRPDEAPFLLFSSRRPLGVGREDPPGSGGLSADGRLVCIQHGERGDAVHNGLRILDHRADLVDEVWDPGSNLNPVAWSPVQGDQRLLFTSELGAFERPAIWERLRERRDLTVDLPGAVIPVGWWPDGSAILARHEHEGIDQLVRIDPGSGDATLVSEVAGEILDAAARPDGAVWILSSDSSRVPRVVDGEGERFWPPPASPCLRADRIARCGSRIRRANVSRRSSSLPGARGLGRR